MLVKAFQIKNGFSLLEVLFAVSFLIMVGVAMTSLNLAAVSLAEATELKQTALSLNEQSISFIAVEKRTNSNFSTTYSSCIAGQTCYVACPETVNSTCTLQTARASTQLGANKLQFTQSVVIRPELGGTTGRYLVNATSSWGNGSRKQITMARIVE